MIFIATESHKTQCFCASVANIKVHMKTIIIINRCSHRLCRRFELLCWIAAIIALFFLPEKINDTSLCLFSLLGLGHCPGCGIGHAIHYALRLDLSLSFQFHPIGIPAVIIIFMRIKRLLYQTNRVYETKPHQSNPRY